MIGLDRLLKKPGVLAAGEFSVNGEMLSGVGELKKEELAEVAGICKKASGLLGDVVVDLDSKTSLDWNSLIGWVIMGHNLALCVTEKNGVIVDTRKADFNQLLADLFGPMSGEVPVP